MPSSPGASNSPGVPCPPRPIPVSPPPPASPPPTATAHHCSQLPPRPRIRGAPALQRGASPRLLPVPIHPRGKHPRLRQPSPHPRLRHVLGLGVQPELLPRSRPGGLGLVPTATDAAAAQPSDCDQTDAIQAAKGGSWLQRGRGWFLNS